MKKFVAGVVLGFIASWGVSFASSGNHNGLFWNRLNQSAKDGYVDGYADARISGAECLKWWDDIDRLEARWRNSMSATAG